MFGAKYQLLLNRSGGAALRHLNNSKSSIEKSNDMDGIYETIEEYNPNKERKKLIFFDNMIADMLRNKKPNPESN